jgi:hypothetical protein
MVRGSRAWCDIVHHLYYREVFERGGDVALR